MFSRLKITTLGPKVSPGMAEVTPREELGSAVMLREEHSIGVGTAQKMLSHLHKCYFVVIKR